MESEPSPDKKTQAYSATDLDEVLGPDRNRPEDNARAMPVINPADALAAARHNVNVAGAPNQPSPATPGEYTNSLAQEAQVHAERLNDRRSVYLNRGPKLLRPLRAVNLWLHNGMPPEI